MVAAFCRESSFQDFYPFAECSINASCWITDIYLPNCGNFPVLWELAHKFRSVSEGPMTWPKTWLHELLVIQWSFCIMLQMGLQHLFHQGNMFCSMSYTLLITSFLPCSLFCLLQASAVSVQLQYSGSR